MLFSEQIMKTKEESFSQRLARIFRRRVRRHDPLLAFNISIFNFTDGWNRTFSKYEYERISA
jgi:hypothetical protein